MPVLRRRVERYPAGEIRFNLLGVCRDLRVRMREVGDWEGLEREDAKRREWAWENALRRWNFLGFVGEVVKVVGAAKVAEGSGKWEEWVQGARDRTKQRIEEKRAMAAVGEMDVD